MCVGVRMLELCVEMEAPQCYIIFEIYLTISLSGNICTDIKPSLLEKNVARKSSDCVPKLPLYHSHSTALGSQQRQCTTSFTAAFSITCCLHIAMKNDGV